MKRYNKRIAILLSSLDTQPPMMKPACEEVAMIGVIKLLKNNQTLASFLPMSLNDTVSNLFHTMRLQLHHTYVKMASNRIMLSDQLI